MFGNIELYNEMSEDSCIYIEDYIKNIDYCPLSMFQEGFSIKNEIQNEGKKFKVIPTIQLAKVDDAEEIADIVNSVYRGTYPYKEFCDKNEIEKMIKDDRYYFILFKVKDEIAGLYNAQLNFKKRKGYFGGLVLKEKFHGKIDLLKSAMVSVSSIYYTFKDKIYIWYGETRTSHSKSQYIVVKCGIKPIAFFPNKDIFLNAVESDLLHIIYNKKAIEDFRSKEIPKLIPQVSDCFLYATSRYNLGPVIFKNPIIHLNSEIYSNIRKKIIIKSESNKFGYEWVNMFNRDTDSYFKFLLTRHLFNIEKMEYKIKCLEELVAFIHELKELMKRKYIRYCECFVSAYKPEHQKIFYLEGFKPRGYVPSWFYDENNNIFEDAVVFNLFKGKLDNNLKLVPEGEELVRIFKV
ncbi:MAG: hypothetical protein ACTSQS_09635 [Promethearchaeota archaeon]